MLKNSQSKHSRQSEKLWSSFQTLRRAPSDLWMVYVVKFLESYAYFSISQTITIFLTEEYHMDDKQAGLVYGMYGAAISVYGTFIGQWLDKLGVRLSLQVGFALSLVSRFILAFSTSNLALYFNLLFLLPLSGAMGIPVMVVAIRRLTDEENRGFAFGLFYATMNVGGLACGPMIDFLTIFWPTSNDSLLTGNRMVFLTCAIASFFGLIVSSIFLPDRRLGSLYNSSQSASGNESLLSLFQDKTFLRFFSFSLLMVNLRGVFRHLDATLPKYLVRIHGPSVNKGLIYAVNPAVIIGLVPIISAATSTVDSFRMIIVGGYISAFSCIYLVVSDSILAAILFVVQLSLGEAMWSPRFLDYQASISPAGKEAAFIAVASAPLFLSKLPVGYLSGFLLQEFCPADPVCVPNETTCLQWIKMGIATCENDFCPSCFGLHFKKMCDKTCGFCMDMNKCSDLLLQCPPAQERQPHIMWLVVLVTTLMSPVLVHLFQDNIREPTVSSHKYTELKRHDTETTDIFDNLEIIEDNPPALASHFATNNSSTSSLTRR